MNKSQEMQMQKGKGFIAALDQSGGSTPKALAAYGIEASAYNTDTEMFHLMHKMRTRIIKSPYFDNDRVLAAILFENTMDSKIDGEYTADYLWDQKGIVPILKVDKGLEPLSNGVQMMKDIPDLEALLDRAKERNIFGTKMRSLIKEFNESSIDQIVQQQFDFAKRILAKDLVPIIEPEVDIHAKDKDAIERYLHDVIKSHLDALDKKVMLKLTPPSQDNLYYDLVNHRNVLRIAFLSGGHSRAVANELLKKNKGIIASFSRALTEGLSANQSDTVFDNTLNHSIQSIFEASIV